MREFTTASLQAQDRNQNRETDNQNPTIQTTSISIINITHLTLTLDSPEIMMISVSKA